MWEAGGVGGVGWVEGAERANWGGVAEAREGAVNRSSSRMLPFTHICTTQWAGEVNFWKLVIWICCLNKKNQSIIFTHIILTTRCFYWPFWIRDIFAFMQNKFLLTKIWN